jgi:glutathione S-transferase
MLKIYGDVVSGNCLKVKWLFDHLGVDYQWMSVDVVGGETRTPGMLALNPAGQAPFVVADDGWVLTQSNAILVHFAEGSPLIPAEARDRARMFEWLFWEQYSHEPAIAVARFQRKYLGKTAEEIDPRLMERGHAALARMETALTGGGWLAGSSPSLADLSLVAYTRMADDGGFDLRPYPAVRGWIRRVDAVFAIA